MELFSFDGAYVQRLREGDPSTEMHFVAYFSRLLGIKLRARYLAPDVIEDLRQETFIRSFREIRSEAGIRYPERLGAFVNAVCNNVMREHYRAASRTQPIEEAQLETSGKILKLDDLLVTEQNCQQVRRVLDSLPERDRALLRAMFFEEKDKDEICNEFAVDRDYLRVLFLRAKDRFRKALDQDQSPTKQGTSGARPRGGETETGAAALPYGRQK